MTRRIACRVVAVATACAAVVFPAAAAADTPAPLSPQTIKLPSGPTSLKGLGESFRVDPATGTGGFGVGFELPPGLLVPQLGLSYSVGHGKSTVGVGWRLSRFRIFRTTDKGLPDFRETDRFAVEGPVSGELVVVDREHGYYRLKNEGAFALFIRDKSDDSWIIKMRDGRTAYLGESGASRQNHGQGTSRWWVERIEDRFGHEVRYGYLRDRGQLYLETIDYQLHAPENLQNHVVLSYETRADVFTDYTYGAPETTALRLQQVAVSHGDRTIRTYRLGYTTRELRSELTSVAMTGENGLAMPTMRFGYVPHTNAGQMVQMRSTPPIEGLTNGSATLEDVNGDGFPDLLVGQRGDYHYYANRNGIHWASSPTPLSGDPDMGLWEPGVVLADANGDGVRDVITPRYRGYRYFPGGDIRDGRFRGYGEGIDLAPDVPLGVEWSSPEAKMQDLDFDGRIDLLIQRPQGLAQVLNDDTNRLVESQLPALPADADFLDPSVQLRDFNGDGHLDIVRMEIDQKRAAIRVWFGLGRGGYATEQRIDRGLPNGDPGEFYLHDVNNDGQADLVRISGTDVSYRLNTGHLSFGRRRGDYLAVPPSYKADKILFADMNGNGTADIVFVIDNRLQYLELTRSPFAGLLERIENGLGAVTTISYDSSAAFAARDRYEGNPWKTPLVTPVPVISEMRATDSLDKLGLPATESVVQYRYADGYYDGKEREFRGFAYVEVSEGGDEHHETKVTGTHFHVGRNLVTGADEEVLKGRAYRQEIRNGAGALYQTIETTWERRWLCQEDLDAGADFRLLPRCAIYPDKDRGKDSLVAFAVQTEALTGHWEKTNNPRWTLATTDVDIWGNPTESANFGEVGLPGGRALGDSIDVAAADTAVGNDEVRNRSVFINKPDPQDWLLGLAQQSLIMTATGDVTARSRVFYDGADFVGLPLGQAVKGLPTRSQQWLAEESRWISTTRTAYNAHGQAVATLDPRDNRVELDYDPESSTFPEAERIFAPQPIEFVAAYDRAFGVVTSSTDANGHTTSYHYDGLGRLEAIVDPEGTLERPLQRFRYTFGSPESPVSITQVEALVDRDAGTYTSAWTYADGLLRERQTKVRAEAEHGYIASAWAEMSTRGSPVRAYDVFATRQLGLEAPPSDTAVTFSTYDALGRAVRVTPPATEHGATYVRTVHYPLETHTFDERDAVDDTDEYPAIARADGRGRTVSVTKHNDIDGRLVKLTWGFAYDERDNLTTITDPQANQRVYDYDSLNRMRSIQDPNAGLTELHHDDVGNLRHRVNALGQAVVYDYGAANRLQGMTLRDSLDGPVQSAYSYHYDAPGAAFPDATNLIGRLARIDGPVDSTSMSYDALGRAVGTVREVWNPNLSTFDDQVRDAFVQRVDLDPQGTALAMHQPGNLTLSMTHNVRRLTTGVTASWPGRVQPIVDGVSYTAAGLAKRQEFGNGIAACATYDRRHRVRSRLAGPASMGVCSEDATAPDSGVGGAGGLGSALQHLVYTRTPTGLLNTVTDESAVRPGVPRRDASYQYDRLYQLTAETTPRGTTSFAYDTIQRLVRRDTTIEHVGDLPLGDFGYGENGAGPAQVTSAGGQTFAYDSAGQMREYRGYALTFDAAGRMTQAHRPGVERLRNYYDATGARVVKIVNRPGERSRISRYPVGGYEERDGAPTWIIDAGGGVTAEIAEKTAVEPDLYLLEQLLAYQADSDSAPRPLAAELLDMDGDGHPTIENTTGQPGERQYPIDRGDIDAAVHRFWDADLGAATDREPVRVVRYYHRDHLGTPALITDSTGEAVASTDGLPYGNEVARHGNPAARSFAGADKDRDTGLGLILMGARWYAPAIGRWISADPLFLETSTRNLYSPLESGLYSYALNNPRQYVDPSGLQGDSTDDTAEKKDPTEGLAVPYGPYLDEITPLSFNVGARGNKDYYRLRYWDFQRRNPGKAPPDYYMNYGDKYLRRFSTLSSELSPEAQRWLWRARANLQLAMEDYIANDPQGFARLEQDHVAFRKWAYQTHVDAYVDAGLADVSYLERIKILFTPDAGDVFFDRAGLGQAWETTKRVIPQDINDGVEVAKEKGDQAVGVLESFWNFIEDPSEELLPW